MAGEFMLADIGTKPLSSVRFEFLKNLMGMGRLPKRNEEEEPVRRLKLKKKRRKEEEKKSRTAIWPPKTAIAWLKQLRYFV